MRYKQAIRIGNNVTDIMKLPCVTACLKLSDGNGFEWLEYIINGDENQRVEQGDWLCEDHDGKWHCLSDEEYRKEAANGK